MNIRQIIFEAIEDERAIQNNKFGLQNKTSYQWITTILEQFGSIAKIYTKPFRDQLITTQDNNYVKRNLIQTAALCVAWLEQIVEEENE